MTPELLNKAFQQKPNGANLKHHKEPYVTLFLMYKRGI